MQSIHVSQETSQQPYPFFPPKKLYKRAQQLVNNKLNFSRTNFGIVPAVPPQEHPSLQHDPRWGSYLKLPRDSVPLANTSKNSTQKQD